MSLPRAQTVAEAPSAGALDADAGRSAFGRLTGLVSDDLEAVGHLIRERMSSEHAPRIPEILAHLI